MEVTEKSIENPEIDYPWEIDTEQKRYFNLEEKGRLT